MNTIERAELQAMISADPALVLLEALPEGHWRKGHLPNARLFPHDRVRELASVAAPRKEARIVVYCASITCQNSHLAAAELTALGYSDVRVYAEGKADWEAAGLPLER
jgi:rhodanese-related sulfurtransferase